MNQVLVFDADVIIHFINAERFSELRNIYPENEKIILDKVIAELKKNKTTAQMLDRFENTFSTLKEVKFPNDIETLKEYSHLTSSVIDIGRGESACMSYCKSTGNAVVSSNLKDVKEYCKRHKISLLTTLDLVYWAFKNNLWTESECNEFISAVKSKKGRLPCNTIDEYIRKFRQV